MRRPRVAGDPETWGTHSHGWRLVIHPFHTARSLTLALSSIQTFRVRLRPNRQAAGRHRQGDRGLHPPAQSGGAELLRAVPVPQGKVAVVFACTRCGSSTTASAARLRATYSALWARSRTWAFPRRCGLWRRRCGIPLPKREFSSPEEAAGARLRTKLLELHETATAWFEEQLRGPEGAMAREYLAGRGLTPEGIKTFRIGYAPDSFNALRDRLKGMADDETLRASGLFSSKEQGDGGAGADLRPLPQAGDVSHRQRERPGDCLYRAHAGDRGKGGRRSTSIRRRRRSTRRAKCCSTWTRHGRRFASMSLRCLLKGRWIASPCFCAGFKT